MTLAELTDFVNTEKGEAGKYAAEDGKVPEPKAPSPVAKLEKDNFEAETKSGVAFVKFFAPWCGHCKRLAPTWEELAGKFAEKAGVKIAKVDCTEDNNKNREICTAQGVNGFPTLNIYKDGEKVDEYNGKRAIDDLEAFVNKHLEPVAKEKDEL